MHTIVLYRLVHSECHTPVLLIQYNQARRNRKGACRGDSSDDVHFCMLYQSLQYGDLDNSLGTILGIIASATYRGEQVVVPLYQTHFIHNKMIQFV